MSSRHAGTTPLARAAVLAVLALVALSRPAAAADPCALLTPGELGQVTGQPVSVPKPAGPGICSATAGAYSVMLRLAERKGTDSSPEEKGIAMIRQMGGTVDVKTFGPMTCSTVSPPAAMVQAVGFNTTCSILKGGWVAAVELTTKAQKDMVHIDKLRPVAEKMNARF